MKNLYNTIGIVLIALLLVTTFIDTNIPYLPVIILVLFAVITYLHTWKRSVNKIVLEGPYAEFEMMDGKTVKVHQREIVMVKFTNAGVVVVNKKKDEFHFKKKNKDAVIIKEGEVLTEFRQEDFPFAEFRSASR